MELCAAYSLSAGKKLVIAFGFSIYNFDVRKSTARLHLTTGSGARHGAKDEIESQLKTYILSSSLF